MYPKGGYKTVTPVQVANALAALDRGEIRFRALRVYLGCFELQARREAAARAAGANRRRSRQVDYRPDELARLLSDVGVASVRTELRRLERARLVVFSPGSLAVTETPLDAARPLLADLCGGRRATRPIPVPRRLLAFLCRCRKPALTKTLLGYVVRGLSLERGSGEVRGAGTAKATWIARVFGISERGARAARAELIRLGVLSKDVGSHQRKLNRDGAYFRINLDWEHPQGDIPGDAGESTSARDGASARERVAPPPPENAVRFAPPEERPGTPSDLKHQKLAARDGAGVCDGNGSVNLRNIRPGDIRRASSLRRLYEQATAAGWLERSEAGFLSFAAAAVHANRADGDPVRIFVSIVRRKLWHHITQADEERARSVITRTNDFSGCGDSFVRELLRRAAA